MNHTARQLIEIACRYFPRLPPNDPGYVRTAEARRQREAHERLRARYALWASLLARIEARFPAQRWPDVSLQNLSVHVQADETAFQDRCFAAYLWLPARAPEEEQHHLTFQISAIVPYYSIRSASLRYAAGSLEAAGRGLMTRGQVEIDDGAGHCVETYDLTSDELPFAVAIGEETGICFPGHELLPASIGRTVVPDIHVGSSRLPGQATLFDCLFSETS